MFLAAAETNHASIPKAAQKLTIQHTIATKLLIEVRSYELTRFIRISQEMHLPVMPQLMGPSSQGVQGIALGSIRRERHQTFGIHH